MELKKRGHHFDNRVFRALSDRDAQEVLYSAIKVFGTTGNRSSYRYDGSLIRFERRFWISV